MYRGGRRSVTKENYSEFFKEVDMPTDFIDTVGLNGWIDEFCDELSFEVLDHMCNLIAIVVAIIRTSRKNFLAPT
jgi:hypothetical protein